MAKSEDEVLEFYKNRPVGDWVEENAGDVCKCGHARYLHVLLVSSSCMKSDCPCLVFIDEDWV